MLQTSQTAQPVVNRLVVIGLGLIGSSLALAARNAGLATQVVGISRRSSTLDLAVELGVIDRPEQSLAAIAPELGAGDLVVIGVPTLTVPAILKECAELLSDQVTITDVASVKGSVMAAAMDIYGHLPTQLVPGHPIAGSEKSGVTAAKADLFKDHRVILTPHADSGESHVRLVENLWQSVGARVSSMDVQEHDEVLAATSHLPHFLAYSLVDTLASMHDNREIFRYAAGGFRDFTRIAASDPIMWRDIALANRQAILTVLDQIMDNFSEMRSAIDKGDETYLMDVFTRAREARNHFGK
jgi:3-phosphoshikimate 1-carboxyvinyltransferase